MNTQTEVTPVVVVSEAVMIENPMQERHCGEVSDFVEVAAEAVFTALRLEARGEASQLFVP